MFFGYLMYFGEPYRMMMMMLMMMMMDNCWNVLKCEYLNVMSQAHYDPGKSDC